MGAPEGCEDLHRPPGRGFHLPGLAEQIRAEALGHQATAGEAGLDGLIDSDAARIVAAVPQHGVRARLGDELVDDLIGRAATQDEALAQSLKALGERTQALGEPPAGRAAERALPVSRFLQHIEADDRRAARRRPGQGRIVGEAEVVAEPDDGRRLRHGRVTGWGGARFTPAG